MASCDVLAFIVVELVARIGEETKMIMRRTRKMLQKSSLEAMKIGDGKLLE